MTKDEAIKYWTTSADNDFRAALHLHEKGDHAWSLFIGHLVIEKLLKARYVMKTGGIPPFIHDLARLAELSALELTEEQKDTLDTISSFNIQGRYDDYKMSFQRKCTDVFSKKWIGEILEFSEWIKKQLQKQ